MTSSLCSISLSQTSHLSIHVFPPRFNPSPNQAVGILPFPPTPAECSLLKIPFHF